MKTMSVLWKKEKKIDDLWSKDTKERILENIILYKKKTQKVSTSMWDSVISQKKLLHPKSDQALSVVQ